MTHNFDAYKQRRTAILITGEQTEDLIEKLRLEEWDIISLDDFVLLKIKKHSRLYNSTIAQ